MEWSDYIAWDTEWLKACDGLMFLGESPGARIELENALALGKHVYYSLDEVPAAEPALEGRTP